MKRRFFVLVFTTLLLISSALFGQSIFQAGMSFDIGFPQDEFKENIESNGYGISGYFGLNFPQSPLVLGITAKYLIYGMETREEPWSPAIPEVSVDVTTTNSIFMTQFFLRIQPSQGKVLPYLDGLAGFSYLTTDTRIKDQGDYEQIASSKIFSDFTFSYGVGTGLQFCVYDALEKNKNNDLMAVYIDVGIQFLKGGIAEYLKEGSIEIDDGDVFYDKKESATDITVMKIGVSFAF